MKHGRIMFVFLEIYLQITSKCLKGYQHIKIDKLYLCSISVILIEIPIIVEFCAKM